MSDPADRCRNCNTWVFGPDEFCDNDGACERAYAERRILRRLALINAMAHASRWRRWVRRRLRGYRS